MELLQQLGDLFVSNWMVLLLFITLIIFAIPELVKRIKFLKDWIGYETPEEKRFKKIESAQEKIVEENKKLKLEIEKAEKRCMGAISNTETKFDDREHEHWEESKMIRNDYDSRIGTVGEKLDIILEKLNKQDQLDLKKLRHAIVRAGEEYIEKCQISCRQLASLEEMYDEYTKTYHANSYVTTLMVKVRALKVVGKLNEHGEDIE